MAISRDDLAACYRRLEQPVFNVLYRRVWDDRQAMDLLHDAFLRVWKRRARVDLERLDALLWTTALNLARNDRRKRRLWQWVDASGLPLTDGRTPVDDARLDERDRAMKRALDRLPDVQRDTLLLSVYSGLDRAALARIFGVPPGTVASRRFQAERSLRRWLNHD